MLKIKQGRRGAKVNGIRGEIILAAVVASQVFAKHGLDCIITEATGSKHGYASIHYLGLAIDLRTSHIKTQAKLNSIMADLKSSLNEQYDIVLESNHIHIEYQPK